MTDTSAPTTSSITQERRVVTAIPGPQSQKLHERRLAAVPVGVGTTLPVYIDRAHGAIVVDVDGNQFIDLGAGIGVTTIGHTNDAVVEAATDGSALAFTRSYLLAFEEALAAGGDAAALKAAMLTRFPGLGMDIALDIGAKVATGEMVWG